LRRRGLAWEQASPFCISGVLGDILLRDIVYHDAKPYVEGKALE